MVLLKEQFEYAKKKHGFPNKRKKYKKNETGFFRVSKVDCKGCLKGYTYMYRWFDIDKDKKVRLSSTDFKELRQKIKEKNLKWEVTDYHKARKTAKEVGLPLIDLK